SVGSTPVVVKCITADASAFVMTTLCAPVYWPEANVIVGIQGSQTIPGPAICTGVLRTTVVPSPMLPELLRPHAQTDASAVSTYPFRSPGPRSAMSGKPVTCAATDRFGPGVPSCPSPFSPTVHTVWSDLRTIVT